MAKFKFTKTIGRLTKKGKEMESLNGYYPELPPELTPHELRPIEYSPADYLPLIKRVVELNKPRKAEMAEAMSVAFLAFIRAAPMFEGRNGAKFESYITQVIKFEVWKLKPVSDDNMVQFDENTTQTAPNTTDERREELLRLIDMSLNLLPEREQFIIKHLYGIDCERCTEQELAKVMSLSQGYISKVKTKALASLRRFILTSPA